MSLGIGLAALAAAAAVAAAPPAASYRQRANALCAELDRASRPRGSYTSLRPYLIRAGRAAIAAGIRFLHSFGELAPPDRLRRDHRRAAAALDAKRALTRTTDEALLAGRPVSEVFSASLASRDSALNARFEAAARRLGLRRCITIGLTRT